MFRKTWYSSPDLVIENQVPPRHKHAWLRLCVHMCVYTWANDWAHVYIFLQAWLHLCVHIREQMIACMCRHHCAYVACACRHDCAYVWKYVQTWLHLCVHILCSLFCKTLNMHTQLTGLWLDTCIHVETLLSCTGSIAARWCCQIVIWDGALWFWSVIKTIMTDWLTAYMHADMIAIFMGHYCAYVCIYVQAWVHICITQACGDEDIKSTRQDQTWSTWNAWQCVCTLVCKHVDEALRQVVWHKGRHEIWVLMATIRWGKLPCL